MGPKKACKSVKVKNTIVKITTEVKKDQTEAWKWCCVSDLALHFHLAKSSVCTIHENKHAVKGASATKDSYLSSLYYLFPFFFSSIVYAIKSFPYTYDKLN